MLSEDLTQNVFERLIRYRESYRSGMIFRTWIYQIARNIKNDYFKNKKIIIDDFSEVERMAYNNMVSPIDQRIEEQERVVLLEKALAQLPPAQREILILNTISKT